MRKIKEEQIQLGEIDISQIKIDLKSRDEIPQLLCGLQYIYCNVELRAEVFALFKEKIKNSKNGRRGMDLWNILVLGVIRLNCNWDYDKLKEIADNHLKIREMLGVSPFDSEKEYPLQTLKDNVSLLTPEFLDQINTIVVKAGQNLVKKNEKIRAKCDSFVVEMDVHYPTDANLLWDSLRKVITIISFLCQEADITGWRQATYQLKECKKLFRICQKTRKSTSKIEEKRKAKEEKNKESHKDYMEKAEEIFVRAEKSLEELSMVSTTLTTMINIPDIKLFIRDGRQQINLINRRVINGEKIPHNEKIFSLFERGTEWICKGKAGISQELGKRVTVIEDQYGFILSHEVMNNMGDKEIVVDFIEKVKNIFPQLYSCSFDKGYWSPENKEKLEEIIEIALPRKGRLSKEAKEYQDSDNFIQANKKHSAVESCINALENHGLDRCPDSGMKNFNRYISFAVLGRNIQKLGSVLIEKEKKREEHSRKIKEGLRRSKLKKSA
jgi:transposase, IS5 family